MAKSEQFFYIVQPGDTLIQIGKRANGSLSPGTAQDRTAQLLKLNPQIKDANRIQVGDLIRLGSPTYPLETVFDSDFSEMQAIWNRTSLAIRDIVQKSFDLLDWMSEQKDKLDYLENVGWQGKRLLEAVPELNYGIIPAEYRKFTVAFSELQIMRGNTILSFQRYGISVRRVPIFIITASNNMFYTYAQKLLRMVEWAEKIHLGRKILFFEIGTEAVKVGRTALIAQDSKETAKQVFRGAAKVASGIAATAVAKKVCGITVRKGPRGWVVCALTLGTAMTGAGKFIEKLGDLMLGPPIDTKLPELP